MFSVKSWFYKELLSKEDKLTPTVDLSFELMLFAA